MNPPRRVRKSSRSRVLITRIRVLTPIGWGVGPVGIWGGGGENAEWGVGTGG